MHVDKILIRGPNWLGDSVLAIPAMKAIRAHFRDAEITLLVRPWVAGLFSSAPFIDHVWSEPHPTSVGDWSRITRAIRAGHFDLAVLFPNSFESALMMFLGRIPMRLGYATDGRRMLLTDAVAPEDGIRHQVYYYLNLIKHLSPALDRPSVEITATAEEKAAAQQLLATEGIRPNEPYVVLNPGAAYGAAKRWDEERFAEVGNRLSSDAGFRVVIVGSAAETPVAEQIRKRLTTTAAVLCGKTSLETLIGVIAHASLMITNDSGPMHIAAALGTPTVAVFGPTDERVTAPFGAKTRVVKHAVACSPCLLRECPIDHRCMTGVSALDVWRAAEELLSHE